jgi:hypothetical protein
MIPSIPRRAGAGLAAAVAVATLLAGVLAGGAAGQARAETGVTDPNGHPFRMPTVSPIESVYRLGPVHVSRGERNRWVALAELGDRWSFWLRQRPEERFELAAAFHIHANSRFDLESVNNTFVEITYRFGGYLRARYGKVAARMEVYHVSAHLGDEYVLEEDVLPISTSREGVDFLFQVAPFDGLILYGGPGWVVRSSRDFRSPLFRLGSEWESAGGAWARPYLGFDFSAWSELDWQPQFVGEGGVALGRNGRLGLLVGLGTPRAEQFFRETETLVGLTFTYRRQ